MDFLTYSLHHAWLIPLLPVLSFLIIVFLLYRLPRLAAAVAIGALGGSFVLAAGVAGAVIANQITMEKPFITKLNWFSVTGLSVDWGCLIDPLTAMMLMVVTIIAFLVAVYSVGYMHGDSGFSRFFAYISLFAASMLAMVQAINFLQLFMLWELVGLCSYLLIGYYFYKVSAREAAKKAFMTTRIGDFGLLLGILLLQVSFGTLDFQTLTAQIPGFITGGGTDLLTMAALLVFCGPVAKSGQFPLHVWLPDAMEGPTPVSALIHAATMVVAGVYLVARAYALFAALPNVAAVIAWIGGFTALFAALIALTQREIKRILAFSTISQLGYMMLALGVGSVTASMFHLMTHAFFKALLFLCAGSVMHALHDTADIFRMGGLRRYMPVTHITMGIGVLAIAGIPPFAGFFSKDEILLAASQVSLPLYFIASLTAVLTAFYMGRMYFSVFYGEMAEDHHPHEAGFWMLAPLVVLSGLSVVGGIVPFMLHFGDWVRFGPAHHAGINWLIAGSSTVLSAASLGSAWLLYGRKTWSSDWLASRMRGFYTLSYHKFYVDELYAWINKVVVNGLGAVLYWIDVNVVDGLVNNLSRSVSRGAQLIRTWESGQIQHYALVYFAAAIILVVWLGGVR